MKKASLFTKRRLFFACCNETGLAGLGGTGGTSAFSGGRACRHCGVQGWLRGMAVMSQNLPETLPEEAPP